MVTLEDFFRYDFSETTLPPPIIQTWEVDGVKPGLIFHPTDAGIDIPLFHSPKMILKGEERCAPVVAPIHGSVDVPVANGYSLRGFTATPYNFFYVVIQRTIIAENLSDALTVRFCYTVDQRGEIKRLITSSEFHNYDLVPEPAGNESLRHWQLEVEATPRGLVFPDGKLTFVRLEDQYRNVVYKISGGNRVWTIDSFLRSTPLAQQCLARDPFFKPDDVYRGTEPLSVGEDEMDVCFYAKRELDLAETMHALFVAAGENSGYSTRQAQIESIAQLTYVRWKAA